DGGHWTSGGLGSARGRRFGGGSGDRLYRTLDGPGGRRRRRDGRLADPRSRFLHERGRIQEDRVLPEEPTRGPGDVQEQGHEGLGHGLRRADADDTTDAVPLELEPEIVEESRAVEA